MKKQRKTVRNILYGTLAVGTLLAFGCRNREPVKEMANSNIRTYTSHASREEVTDMDFDGKYDVLKRGIAGKGEKLFYKKGYGPAQDPRIEYEFVEPDFFENYDAELFKSMIKEYYRLKAKNE